MMLDAVGRGTWDGAPCGAPFGAGAEWAVFSGQGGAWSGVVGGRYNDRDSDRARQRGQPAGQASRQEALSLLCEACRLPRGLQPHIRVP